MMDGSFSIQPAKARAFRSQTFGTMDFYRSFDISSSLQIFAQEDGITS